MTEKKRPRKPDFDRSIEHAVRGDRAHLAGQDSRSREQHANGALPESWKVGDLVRFAHGPGPFKVTSSDPRTQMLELQGFSGLFAWSLFVPADAKIFD